MKHMTNMTIRMMTMAGLVALASAGCFSRLHMSEHHGRAYKQAFARQAVNPPGQASAKTPKGLDALESTIVVETYRRGLAASQGGSGASGNQMILLSPNSGQLGYTPPSAPAAPAK